MNYRLILFYTLVILIGLFLSEPIPKVGMVAAQETPDEPVTSEEYNIRGSAALMDSNFEQAIADFDDAIELDPEFVPAYFFRSLAYRGLRRNELALADVDRAIELDPSLPELYFLRGLVLEDLIRPAEALVSYQVYIDMVGLDADPMIASHIKMRESEIGESSPNLGHITGSLDVSHPLLEMLSYISMLPETGVFYVDIQASVVTRTGTRVFSSKAEWQEFEEDQSAWLAALPIPVLPQFSVIRFSIDDDLETTGFSIFDVNQIFWFGTAPYHNLLLQGDFDNQEVTNAYTQRGWEVAQDEDMYRILCSIDGCDMGHYNDFEQRNNANFFGGDLGRRQPIAIGDNWILSSPDYTVFEDMLNTNQSDSQSLAHDEMYRVAVAAIAEHGTIRQAGFFSPSHVIARARDLPLTISPEARQVHLTQVMPLPLANLVMIADTADVQNQTQAGHLVLVYDNATNALAASEALNHNVQPDSGVLSFQARNSIYSLLTNRGQLQPIEATVYDEAGYSIVVVTISDSLVTANEIEDTSGNLLASGYQFQLFQIMMQVRDTGWMGHH